MKFQFVVLILFSIFYCNAVISQEFSLAMSDTSLAIIDETSILKEVKSQLLVDPSNNSGEVLLRGNFAKISINNLQIGDLGGNELGIDGDIVPYESTTFDLGNNVVGEHWDQVVANTFVTYTPPGNIISSTYKSIGSVLPALLEITPLRSIDKSVGQSLVFDTEELLAHTPEVLVVSDIDHNSDSQEKISKKTIPGINYDAFVPILIKAIQEQQEQIQSLKKEIQTLSEKLENN